MPEISGLMRGKRGLIMGVANNRSIAWGIAQAMHQRFDSMGILCMDCHDPHAGDGAYFLK